MKQLFVFTLSLLFFTLSAFADVRPEILIPKSEIPRPLPMAAQMLVDFETLSNPAGERSNLPFWIEHLEIPLNVLDVDVAKGLDPRIRESLVFQKSGVPHVRWVLNPEDTMFANQLIEKLAARGVNVTPLRYFIGYLTASRSCIVQDPHSGVTFSIKASTNKTGGHWRMKQETVRAAKAGRLMSDYLQNGSDSSEMKYMRMIPEPLAFSFADADQAVIVRQYDHFNDPKQERFLIPVFSVVHEKTGAELAARNGSSSPQGFWMNHLITPLAYGMTEVLFYKGILNNSPHGQNYLIEVDRNWLPTKVIYGRDSGDAHLQTQIIRARGGHKVLEHYKNFRDNHKYNQGYVTISANPFFNGFNERPTWIKNRDLWRQKYIESARSYAYKIFYETLNVRQKPFEFRDLGGDYWSWDATLPPNELERFLKKIGTSKGSNCSSVFASE